MPPGSFELFEAGSSKNEKTKQNKFSNVFIHNPQVLSSAFIFHYLVSLRRECD